MSFPPSDHFNGKTFFNPRHENRTWQDVLRWRRTSRPTPWPAEVPLGSHSLPPPPSGSEWIITAIGHVTFLIQSTSGNILTDPHFGERCGPFDRLGPKRVQPPALALEKLPPIATILLSHDHYDHCHLPTLRALARLHDPLVITPLANASLLRRAGLRHIVELDWWTTHIVSSDTSVTLTPARHWSNRLSGKRNARLWGGFFVRDQGRAWWFAGDTGYDPELFKAIRQHLGPPQLAMIPIGAYEPRWFMAAQHCNPAEAVQIHRDVGAETSLGMHWGTWQLTDEGREEPLRALDRARSATGVAEHAFRTLNAGESLVVGPANIPELTAAK
jgi:L-ascorbate metabolism protein UlaG (beta-lactamase superfamily)